MSHPLIAAIEAFERHIRGQFPTATDELLLGRRRDGKYGSMVTEHAWRAWQAAALSAALQPAPHELDAEYERGRRAGITQVYDAQAVASEPEAVGDDRGDAARYRWLRKNLMWADALNGEVRWALFLKMPAPIFGDPAITFDQAVSAASAETQRSSHTDASDKQEGL